MSRKALLISNSQYHDPKLRDLQAPDADVQALQSVLADPRIGDFDVTVLADQEMDITRREIARFFAQGKRNDLLLLYFTGHGVLDQDSRLHLATVDSERGILRASAVEASFVAAEMKGCLARSQILILDCCHSGAFAKESTKKGKHVGDSVGTRATFDGTGHVILTASDMLQYAYEGDEIAGQATLSVFTRLLVEGLESGDADLNSDGCITPHELYEYIYQRMQDEVDAGRRQTPMQIVPSQKGEMLVARNPFTQQALPAELQAVLENPLPRVRLVAVEMLVELLDNPNYDAIALATLENLTEDDSRMVSNAALQALGQRGQTQPVITPAIPKTDPFATLRKTMPHSLEMAFCYVPPGRFTMGSESNKLKEDYSGDETPQHMLDIPYGYFMGKTPVTNAQFQEFVADGGYAEGEFWVEAQAHDRWQDGKIKRTRPERKDGKWIRHDEMAATPFDFGKPFNNPNHPVVGITWYEALAYSRWLTRHLHQVGLLADEDQITLPSEAEWEKTARGGHEIPSSPFIYSAYQLNVQPNQLQLEKNPLPARIYPWGNQFESSYVNGKESGIEATSAVDAYPQGVSPYGVSDMAGNVWEWTWSLQGYDYPYKMAGGREQLDVSDMIGRILRGGSYYDKKNFVRCTFRGRSGPYNGYYNSGFRCCCRRPLISGL